MTAPKKDNLLNKLELELRKALRDKDLKQSDRIKLLEVGAKLLAVRHKVEGGDTSGNFFAK